MTELIQRYRHAGSGIVVTSATLITLVGCVALFLQSRLGALHYPGIALTTRLTSSLAFEKIIWVAWFALGVSLVLLVYECRKDYLIRWVTGSFLVFLIADLIDRELVMSSFSGAYPWIVRLCATAGSIAATVFVAGLPISVRRLTLIVRDTTRSRDNELRLMAAAESSADSVILYDSVYDAAGEISDFRFIFLRFSVKISTRSSRTSVPKISSTDKSE
jgi:hypothetical protein